MISPEQALVSDLASYIRLGGSKTYPFPVSDFAMRVFGLDIQYEDFTQVFESHLFDPQNLAGCLFPDRRFFCGFDKVILLNDNRAPFEIEGHVVPERFYKENAERQTIAHETGHYSFRYVHHKNSQFDLFNETAYAHDLISILTNSEKDEVWANKYSRLLLMPNSEVRNLILERNLPATIDARVDGTIFTDYFGVTQFMVEIRLEELKIPTVNGAYIHRVSRFRGAEYTEGDLHVLLDVAKKTQATGGYYHAERLSRLYNMVTNQNRASGPLYMAFWRVMKGKYDQRFPSLIGKRMNLILHLNSKVA